MILFICIFCECDQKSSTTTSGIFQGMQVPYIGISDNNSENIFKTKKYYKTKLFKFKICLYYSIVCCQLCNRLRLITFLLQSNIVLFLCFLKLSNTDLNTNFYLSHPSMFSVYFGFYCFVMEEISDLLILFFKIFSIIYKRFIITLWKITTSCFSRIVALSII